MNHTWWRRGLWLSLVLVSSHAPLLKEAVAQEAATLQSPAPRFAGFYMSSPDTVRALLEIEAYLAPEYLDALEPPPCFSTRDMRFRNVSAWLPDSSSWFNLKVRLRGPERSRLASVEVRRGWPSGREVTIRIFEEEFLSVWSVEHGGDSGEVTAYSTRDPVARKLRELAERALALPCRQ